MEMYNINEAFKALEDVSLDELSEFDNQKLFSLNDEDDIENIETLLLSDEDIQEDPIEMITDIEADDEEELKDTYVGDVILQCNSCKEKIYRKEDDLVLADKENEEDEDVYNVDLECPHCHQYVGYELIGKVAPYNAEESEELKAEVNAEEGTGTDEEDIKVEDEVKDGDDEVKVEDEFKFEESLNESLTESDKPAAQSIEDAQKWVDYDMKHYGKISGRTNDLVKKAGFQIVKDDHGDYEVAAGKYESCKEECKEEYYGYYGNMDIDYHDGIIEYKGYKFDEDKLEDAILSGRYNLRDHNFTDDSGDRNVFSTWMDEHIKGILETLIKEYNNDNPLVKDFGLIEEECKESCELKEEPIYDLNPQFDSRKSFYGKAKVDTGDKNDKNKLYSYNTLVAEIKDGKPVVYGTYSQTTLRHIKDWLQQNGFRAVSAKQILADYGVKDESLKESFKSLLEGYNLDDNALEDALNYFMHQVDGDDKKEEEAREKTIEYIKKHYGVKEESCKESCDKLEEKSQEIDRNGFASLIKYDDPVFANAKYGVLNDGNFCYKFWAEDDDEAKKIFAVRGVKCDEELKESLVKLTESNLPKEDKEFEDFILKYDSRDGFSIESKKSGKSYSLVEFKTLDGASTTDVFAIFDDSGVNDVDIVEWYYGASLLDDELLQKNVFPRIKEYEGIKESCNEEKCEECDDKDIKVEEIDEKLFNTLVNNYIKEVYDNVDSYVTTGGSVDNKSGQIVLEGKINFKSGKSQDTKFVFENAQMTKKGKIRFVGLNETFTKNKKAFAVQGILKDNNFLTESFTYNYSAKTDSKPKRLYGTFRNDLKEELKVIMSMSSYEPWSGAEETYRKIVDNGLWDEFENMIEEIYPDGITETQLNDLLWFEPDWCLELVGLKDEEEVDESLDLTDDPDVKKQILKDIDKEKNKLKNQKNKFEKRISKLQKKKEKAKSQKEKDKIEDKEKELDKENQDKQSEIENRLKSLTESNDHNDLTDEALAVAQHLDIDLEDSTTGEIIEDSNEYDMFDLPIIKALKDNTYYTFTVTDNYDIALEEAAENLFNDLYVSEFIEKVVPYLGSEEDFFNTDELEVYDINVPGFKYNGYVDITSIANAIDRNFGPGHELASFDGKTIDEKVNGKTYYMFLQDESDTLEEVEESLDESKKGFKRKYKGCSIHDAGDQFVVTNEHGKTIGQSKTEVGCEAIIDDYLAEKDESLKEDYQDFDDIWDDIREQIVVKVNEKFPDAIDKEDVEFDDSKAWSLFIRGSKLGLPVSKFGAYRNYEGGGVRGKIQNNGREKDGTVELGKLFEDKLREIENALNKGSEDEFDKPTGVLESLNEDAKNSLDLINREVDEISKHAEVIKQASDTSKWDEEEDTDKKLLSSLDNESLKESKLNERGLTKAERHNRMMDRISNNYNVLKQNQMDFLVQHGVSEEEVKELRKHTGLGKDAIEDKMVELGIRKEFFDNGDIYKPNKYKESCEESLKEDWEVHIPVDQIGRDTAEISPRIAEEKGIKVLHNGEEIVDFDEVFPATALGERYPTEENWPVVDGYLIVPADGILKGKLAEATYDVTDQVIVKLNEPGFISKKHDLEEKGYKLIGSGDGQMIYAKPKEIKDESLKEDIEVFSVRDEEGKNLGEFRYERDAIDKAEELDADYVEHEFLDDKTGECLYSETIWGEDFDDEIWNESLKEESKGKKQSAFDYFIDFIDNQDMDTLDDKIEWFVESHGEDYPWNKLYTELVSENFHTEAQLLLDYLREYGYFYEDEVNWNESLKEDINKVVINPDELDEVRFEADDMDSISVESKGNEINIHIHKDDFGDVEIENKEVIDVDEIKDEPYISDVEDEIEAEFGKKEEPKPVEMIAPTEGSDDEVVSDEEVNAEVEAEFGRKEEEK